MKLTPPQIAELLERYKKGETYPSILKDFNCCSGTIVYYAKKAGLPSRGRTGRPREYTGLETEFTCEMCRQTLPKEMFNGSANARTQRAASYKCKQCAIEWRTRRAYNLSHEQYMAAMSSNCCICGKDRAAAHAHISRRRNLFIDHDHVSGLIRGVLCESCNSGLGHILDSVERLEQLIAYLQSNRTIFLKPSIPLRKVKLTTQREYHVLKNYGLTPEQYNSLIGDRTCHCCKVPMGAYIAVDHCHSTNVIRGLLCRNCNITLGKFEDDPTRIQRAINYLKSPPGLPHVSP